MADTREKALQDYRKKLLEHKEIDGRLKECKRQFNADVCSVEEINLIRVYQKNIIGWPASASLPAS